MSTPRVPAARDADRTAAAAPTATIDEHADERRSPEERDTVAYPAGGGGTGTGIPSSRSTVEPSTTDATPTAG